MAEVLGRGEAPMNILSSLGHAGLLLALRTDPLPAISAWPDPAIRFSVPAPEPLRVSRHDVERVAAAEAKRERKRRKQLGQKA